MEDDRLAFLEQRARRLKETSGKGELQKSARQFFREATLGGYSYNFDWLGVPIIQFPQDIVAAQEIVWKTKPDLIIETGVARGGSLIFYASMLKLLGNGGRVVGIDIDIRPHNRDSIEKHPLGDIVSLIQGSSIDEAVVYQAAQIARSAKSVMVVLDSNHTHEHVLRELELYAPLVTKGNYMVVYDTVVEFMEEDEIGDRPWSRGNNPLTAVRAFLENNQQFAIDESVDAKLLVSVGPSGYLKRIR